VREEIGEEDLATEVIKGGNESPFFLGKGRPQVGGGVVLDQSADGTGYNRSVVGFSLASGVMAAEFLGSIDDSSHRDLNAILSQTVSQCRVVVVRDG